MRMETYSRVTFQMESLTDTSRTKVQMVVPLLVNGKRGRNVGMAKSPGHRKVGTKGSIATINGMAVVSTNGRMARFTTVIGN
jgi:hypothetical protein